MKTLTYFRHFILACIASLLCACLGNTGLSSIAGGIGEEVSANTWQLTQGNLDNKPLATSNANVTLQVQGSTFIGNSGVNQYRAPVVTHGRNISVENIFISRMSGSIDALQLETDYLSALRRVNKYQHNDNTLTLSGEGVMLQYQLSSTQK